MDTEENVIRKIKPHNELAENCVLGSMLLDPKAVSEATESLKAVDFYYKKNQQVFSAMCGLHIDGLSLDPLTVSNKCTELGYSEEVGDMGRLLQLADGVPSANNVGQYINIVKDRATLRRLIEVSEKIANDAYSDNRKPDEMFEQMETDLFRYLQTRRGVKEVEPIQDVVMTALDNINEAILSKGNITGVPTGFIDLDEMLTGLHPTELLLVAARPAMGKTAFVLNIAAYACFRKNLPVAIFSLEMGREQLATRMIAMESLVDSQKIRTGDLSEEDLRKVVDAATIVGNSRLMIDDTPGITLSELSSKCRKMKHEQGLDLIIIDYLQLMSAGHRIESRQQEVAEISRGLKGLAKELDVPVIALSQLSRAVEAREDHRPRMSDLRESGSIEQDADVVMFIYRDDYYNPDTTTKPGVAEIIIGKQRSGATGSVELLWLGKYTKFVNKERAKKRRQEPD